MVLFLCSCAPTFSQTSFYKYTPNVSRAHHFIYELRFTEAENILQLEKGASPGNIALYWIENYVIFLKNFISEETELYQQSLKKWEQQIQAIQKNKINSPWYRHILAEAYLQRAFVKFKMQDNLSAASDFKSAFSHLKENEKLYPTFLPDNKNIGLIECALSAIPNNYQWIANLFGFTGSMEKGLKSINTYLKSTEDIPENELLKTEAAFINALLQYHFNKDSNAAWNSIEPYTRNYAQKTLLIYFRATILNYTGSNDEVIKLLSNRPSIENSFPFYYLDFMLGVAKLRNLNTDADGHFLHYIQNFRGKNYKKASYRYLAWSSILKGNYYYTKYYKLCITNGNNIIEEDKQAQREAEDIAHIWTKEAIKARLLYDGKHYLKALSTLHTINIESQNTIKNKLEINYRYAKVYQALSQTDSATIYYEKTISLGRNEPYYYAAYSALQIGYIYETNGNTTMAKKYFNMAINNFPNNQEYRNSIEQKAKIALKRIK